MSTCPWQLHQGHMECKFGTFGNNRSIAMQVNEQEKKLIVLTVKCVVWGLAFM